MLLRSSAVTNSPVSSAIHSRHSAMVRIPVRKRDDGRFEAEGVSFDPPTYASGGIYPVDPILRALFKRWPPPASEQEAAERRFYGTFVPKFFISRPAMTAAPSISTPARTSTAPGTPSAAVANASPASATATCKGRALGGGKPRRLARIAERP